MSLLHQAAEPWQAWIVASSWQLALVIVLVATIAWAARGASPRLRHALWLLVLMKVFLPPGLTAPWSLGRWGIAPLLASVGLPRTDLPQWLAGQAVGPAPHSAIAGAGAQVEILLSPLA